MRAPVAPRACPPSRLARPPVSPALLPRPPSCLARTPVSPALPSRPIGRVALSKEHALLIGMETSNVEEVSSLIRSQSLRTVGDHLSVAGPDYSYSCFQRLPIKTFSNRVYGLLEGTV